MKIEKFVFKNPDTGTEFTFDVHAGDMNAMRQLYALQEKIVSLKNNDLGTGDIVSLYDKILGWIDFVLGDGGFAKIYGEHYSVEDIMAVFTALGTFVIDSAKNISEKYSTNNIGVPNEPITEPVAENK